MEQVALAGVSDKSAVPVPNLPRQRPVSFAARGQNASETDRQQVNAGQRSSLTAGPRNTGLRHRSLGVSWRAQRCASARRCHQRGDGASRRQPQRRRNARSCRLLRLSAARLGRTDRCRRRAADRRQWRAYAGHRACGACHGDLGSKAGAAWLEGQPLVYLRSQLELSVGRPAQCLNGRPLVAVARSEAACSVSAASRPFPTFTGLWSNW